MKLKEKLILVIILLIAIVCRFWDLGKTPKGFYLDEAALGYNAYSIMQTGKDEFGKSYPVLLRSFVDFKAPVYSYFLIPIYKFFGMSVWSTRILSAMAGIVAIWFGFWLIKNLSQNTKLSLISVLFLAICPWHIIFCRTSYETNLAFTFLVISLWAFYKFKQDKKYLILAGVMAALSFLTYHSERAIVPLIFLILFIKYGKDIFNKKNIRALIIALILGLVLILPTIKLMATPGFLSRINTLSILSKTVKQPWGFEEKWTGWKTTVFNNQQLLQMREFGSLYSVYFSPRYLFGLGDPGPRSSYPDLASFFLWQLPFLIMGIVELLKKNKDKKDFKFLIVILLLISPIPASITRDPFSNIRALPLVLPLVIIMSIGMDIFLKKFKKWGLIILIGLTCWSSGKIYLSVFKFNDYFRGWAWEEGIQEMTEKIRQEKLPIIVDSARGEIYSQILFFTKTDPKKYQENNFEVKKDEYYTNMNRNKIKQIGNITVRNIRWHEDIYKEQILVGDSLSIGEDQMKEHCLSLIFEIKDREGKVIFRGVKTHPKDKEKFFMGDTKNGQIVNTCKITTP